MLRGKGRTRSWFLDSVECGSDGRRYIFVYDWFQETWDLAENSATKDYHCAFCVGCISIQSVCVSEVLNNVNVKQTAPDQS